MATVYLTNSEIRRQYELKSSPRSLVGTECREGASNEPIQPSKETELLYLQNFRDHHGQ